MLRLAPQPCRRGRQAVASTGSFEDVGRLPVSPGLGLPPRGVTPGRNFFVGVYTFRFICRCWRDRTGWNRTGYRCPRSSTRGRTCDCPSNLPAGCCRRTPGRRRRRWAGWVQNTSFESGLAQYKHIKYKLSTLRIFSQIDGLCPTGTPAVQRHFPKTSREMRSPPYRSMSPASAVETK